MEFSDEDDTKQNKYNINLDNSPSPHIRGLRDSFTQSVSHSSSSSGTENH